MPTITIPDPTSIESRHTSSAPLDDHQFEGIFAAKSVEMHWNPTMYVSLLMLVALWAIQMYSTWATWGNLSVDAGHEIYVPAMLAQGKMLYRDVWYLYGPAAPYFNSYLFRVFGVQLNVLYWAGSLSALGSAILLFLVGTRLSSWLIGWTAGAIVLLQAFHAWLFSFPLPYSFASVYGCLVGCMFLWLVVRGSVSTHWIWTLGAGMAAAVALLLKLEYGIACYATLALMIAMRCFRQRSFKSLPVDFLAILPGMLACVLVINWMISIAGTEFITQENIMSWPTSYFMKTFGQIWLEGTGFTVSGKAFLGAAARTIPLAACLFVSYCTLWWKRFTTRMILLQTMFVLAAILYCVVNNDFNHILPRVIEIILSTIFFPSDMVLYVILAALAAVWYFYRGAGAIVVRSPEIPLLLTFSSLLAFRILMKMAPEGYAIYYNGPVVLSFLLLLSLMVPRRCRSRRFRFLGEVAICIGCLTPVALHARGMAAEAKDYVPLTTERGTVKVSQQVADNYRAAIQFMKIANSRGESVLIVPEDTSLYFLSGMECPTRVFVFNPGVVAPGKMMDELIEEIERKKVHYLLWSNRIFPEYGTPVFGRDFAQPLGAYFESHYQRGNRLVSSVEHIWDLSFTVWKRKSESEIKNDRR